MSKSWSLLGSLALEADINLVVLHFFAFLESLHDQSTSISLNIVLERYCKKGCKRVPTPFWQPEQALGLQAPVWEQNKKQ